MPSLCHSRAANFVLGPSDLQMNRDFTYAPGQTDNQLRTLERLGVLHTSSKPIFQKAPERRTHLVDPADASQTLDARARSYLHANCAHCHVEAGGGNASVDLDYLTDPANARLFDTPAQSNPFDTPGAKLIATGHPAASVLYHRLATRGPGQMPPVGSNVVDESAAALIRDWIAKLPTSTQPSTPSPKGAN